MQIDYIFHCKAIIQPIIGNDDADPEVTAKVNELIADQFTHKEKPPFPIPSQHGDENYENMKNKVKDVFTKSRHFKQFEKTSKDRLSSIPKNATIRQESIKWVLLLLIAKTNQNINICSIELYCCLI